MTEKHFTKEELVAFDEVSENVSDFLLTMGRRGKLICSIDAIIYEDGDRVLRVNQDPKRLEVLNLKQLIKEANKRLKELEE